MSESRSLSDQPWGRDKPPGRDDMWAPVTGLAAGSQKLAAAWLRAPAGCIIAGCRLEPKWLLSILKSVSDTCVILTRQGRLPFVTAFVTAWLRALLQILHTLGTHSAHTRHTRHTLGTHSAHSAHHEHKLGTLGTPSKLANSAHSAHSAHQAHSAH
jgi:hypothetical protein